MSLQRYHHYPPTPEYEGWVSTPVLGEMVLPAYSAWPCESHAGGSRAVFILLYCLIGVLC